MFQASNLHNTLSIFVNIGLLKAATPKIPVSLGTAGNTQKSCTEPDQPQYCLQQSALNLYRIALSHDDYLRELHHTQA
jgi:hypothetical protein